VPQLPPEILEADLAPLALELAAAGVRDPAELRWLDPPPAAAFAQARELLAELGALDADGRVTAHGRRMAALALHPRLAHMLLAGAQLGLGAVACDLGALLAERDVLRAAPGAPRDADLRLRLELLSDRDALEGSGYARGLVADRDALRRVREQARLWRRQLGARDDGAAASGGDVDAAGLLLALAYPDRIAQRRPGAGGRFLLRNGRGAAFGEPQPLSEAPYLVVAELDGQERESRIFLAAPVALDDLERHLGEQVETERRVAWDDEAQAVRAVERERLGAIVLRERALASPDPAQVAAALADALRARGLDALPWDRASRQLVERLRFARAIDPSWPDVSDEALLADLDDWLGPHLAGLRRLDEVQRLRLDDLLLGRLSWAQRARLDALAPTHFVAPTGSRIHIDYADPAAPSAAVRLQELFGLTETPRLGDGRVPLTLQLLSPAQRPVQVTRDLAGFWRSSYFDVRRELKGRYPKHPWPDDPLAAEPTRRVKPRGS